MSVTTGRIDPAAAGAQVRLAGPSATAALIAGLLGVFILFGVGFAGSATLHNAAHDARHAFAFPCH
jgi:cobalt transporter subunit CbtB